METIIIRPLDGDQEKALLTILDGLKIPYEVQDDELLNAMEQTKGEVNLTEQEFNAFRESLKEGE